MVIYVGIDPDTTHTGVAVLHGNGDVQLLAIAAKGRTMADRAVEMARNLSGMLCGFQSFDFLAVEWQALHPGREKNPNAIMGVMAVAGMALSATASRSHGVYTPLPSEWRGTMPKAVIQARILKEADGRATAELERLKPAHREHCIDALGLCYWLRRGRRLWSQV